MDEMEIMNNNEEVVEEVTEKIIETNSGNGWKIGVCVGAALLVGIPVYKYLIKPIIVNHRIKKEQLKVINGGANNQEEHDDNSDED